MDACGRHDDCCRLCGSEAAPFQCQRCGEARYCSKAHQAGDWQLHHRQVCGQALVPTPPFRVERVQDRGRTLVVTREINRGALVFEESPLILAPNVLDPPTCLRCFKRLGSLETAFRCEGCGFACCDHLCRAELGDVHDLECLLLSDVKYRRWVEENPNLMRFIARGLAVRLSRPDAWKQVVSLSPTQVNTEYRELASLVASVMGSIPELAAVQQADVESLITVCNSCAHGCHRAEDAEATNSLMGLFSNASLPEHNCVPNCARSFRVQGRDLILQCRALRAIAEGERITLAYMDLHMPTHRRQAELEDKAFRCVCSRCEDPAEFGSSISSLRCQECGRGHLTPPSPNYDITGLSWPCDACEEELSWTRVSTIEGSWFARLQEAERLASAQEDLVVGKRLLADFRRLCQPIFHHNHWILLRCNLALATFHFPLLVGRQDFFSECPVREACEHVLATYDCFGPEFNASRSRICTVLAASLCTAADATDAGVGREPMAVRERQEKLLSEARELRAVVYGAGRADTYL